MGSACLWVSSIGVAGLKGALSWGPGDPRTSSCLCSHIGSGGQAAERGKGIRASPRQSAASSSTHSPSWGRFPVWWLLSAGHASPAVCTGECPGRSFVSSHLACSQVLPARLSWAGVCVGAGRGVWPFNQKAWKCWDADRWLPTLRSGWASPDEP